MPRGALTRQRNGARTARSSGRYKSAVQRHRCVAVRQRQRTPRTRHNRCATSDARKARHVSHFTTLHGAAAHNRSAPTPTMPLHHAQTTALIPRCRARPPCKPAKDGAQQASKRSITRLIDAYTRNGGSTPQVLANQRSNTASAYRQLKDARKQRGSGVTAKRGTTAATPRVNVLMPLPQTNRSAPAFSKMRTTPDTIQRTAMLTDCFSSLPL